MRISGFLISAAVLVIQAGILRGQSRFLPSAIRVGTDVSNLLQSAFDEKASKYQIHGDIDIHKFFLVGEYGKYKTITYAETFRYDNEGEFFRVGFDYNIMHNSIENNVFFIGLRYAQSVFDDQTSFVLENPIWGTQPIVAGNLGVMGRWYEITSGLKVRIWNQIYLGYTFRIKFILRLDGVGTVDTFSVPGFGRTDRTTTVGLNYQIFYRIPFRDKKKPPDA